MFELWKSMSDDQIALFGCAAALLVAGAIMSLSYYIGRARIASSQIKARTVSPFGSQIAQRQPASLPAEKRREAA
jgi:hypothetical protein